MCARAFVVGSVSVLETKRLFAVLARPRDEHAVLAARKRALVRLLSVLATALHMFCDSLVRSAVFWHRDWALAAWTGRHAVVSLLDNRRFRAFVRGWVLMVFAELLAAALAYERQKVKLAAVSDLAVCSEIKVHGVVV